MKQSFDYGTWFRSTDDEIWGSSAIFRKIQVVRPSW